MVSRRDFFKKAFLFAGAGAIVQLFGKTNAFAALKPVLKDPECKGTAGGLGYVDNLALALKNKKIQKSLRKEPTKTWKPLDQKCSNCMFFGQNMGKHDNSCQLIPGCAVNPRGSCNSWTPTGS